MSRTTQKNTGIRMKKDCMLLLALATAISASAVTKDNIADTTRLHSIEEVVVTGSNNATPKRLLPYTVSIINDRQIEATGKTQLLAALSGEVPSLFVTQRNILGFGVGSHGGSGGIKIRGVGGSPTSGVLMMVDGQPQFAGLYSHPVADFYESEYVDHVEVLRGPGSVLYGSNAMGGVINVITKRAKTDGVHTAITSQYGSHNTWQSSLTNMTRFGRFSSLVSAGYDRTDGLRKNFDFKQSSLYAKIGYELSHQWSLAADYSLMNYRGNDPVNARIENPEATDIYHQNVTRGEASISVSNNYGSTNGVARVYYSYGNHYIDDPRHFHSLDDRLGILAYENFSPWRMASATIGFDFNRYTGKIPVSGGHSHGDGSQQAQMQTIARKFIAEYSPYITLQQRLFDDIITLNAGVRLAMSNRFSNQWLPQFGFTVRPAEGWSVKASIAKGYRNPAFSEMYLYRIANDELDPERMINYEVGIGKHFSKYLTLDLTAYYANGSNLIQTTSVPTAEGGTMMRYMNTGSFINKGIELSAQSNPLDNLLLRASYSYMHSSVGDLTAAPRNQYFLGIAWRVLPQLNVDARLNGIGGLFVYNDMERENYALLGMKVTYTPVKCLDIFANLDNITDVKYQINRGYDMPGFTAMGGVRVRF